jgi:hypothetical protein
MGLHDIAGLIGVCVWGLSLGACAPQEPSGDPVGVAELRVSPDEVAAGEEVDVTLVNRSEDLLGYNLCPAVLDRREGDGWVEDPLRPAEVCTMELRTLAPGDSGHFRHTVPPALTAGEYRFRVGIEAPLGGGRVEVASGPFQVRR